MVKRDLISRSYQVILLSQSDDLWVVSQFARDRDGGGEGGAGGDDAAVAKSQQLLRKQKFVSFGSCLLARRTV